MLPHPTDFLRVRSPNFHLVILHVREEILCNHNQFITNLHPSSLFTSWWDDLFWRIFTTLFLYSPVSLLTTVAVNVAGKTGTTDSTCHQHLEKLPWSHLHCCTRLMLYTFSVEMVRNIQALRLSSSQLRNWPRRIPFSAGSGLSLMAVWGQSQGQDLHDNWRV